LGLELFRREASEHDVDSLDHRQEDATDDGGSDHGRGPVSYGQDGTRDGAGSDGVPRIFLLAQVDEGTVDGAESPAPNGEVATGDRRFRLDASQHAG